MNAPRGSVLLPMRDAGATIDAALRSVLRQRVADLEVVVVDDGSRDDGGVRVRRLAERDPRVRLLERPARGLVAALQAGLAACRAPFVARMDADDWMHRDRLVRQLDALQTHPSWSLVGCHVRCFPREALGPGRRDYEAWLNGMRSEADLHREAFVECPLAHPTWMARREMLRGLGYRDCGWPEDYDLLLRALQAGHRLGVVPERLHGWRHGDERHSLSSPVYAADRFTACKAAFLAAGFLRDHETYTLWGYGGTGRALRRALSAHGREPAAIVELHPGRIGNRIHGAPVVTPDELAALPRRPLLASVAGASARARIRAHLAGLGHVEGRDFLCVA